MPYMSPQLRNTDVNVTDYGATPGPPYSVEHGYANSGAFQRAIDAITGSANPVTTGRVASGKLVVPGGIWALSAGLNIISTVGFHMVGDGPGITRLAPVNAGFGSVLNINGCLDGVFESFAIQGNGNEQCNSAIKLDWNPAVANRSTSGVMFRDIRIRGTKSIVGLDLSGTAANQLDGTVLQNVGVTGGLFPATWTNTGNWQDGILIGNGTQGNIYDHVAYASYVSQHYHGWTVNCSGFALFGSQPGSNFIDFNLVNPVAQITVENIQSQNAQQFIVCGGNASPVPISFRDVLYKPYTGAAYNPNWINTGTSYGNWSLDNLTFAWAVPTSAPYITLDSAEYHAAFNLRNISQPNTLALGVLPGALSQALVSCYQDTTSPNRIVSLLNAYKAGGWVNLA